MTTKSQQFDGRLYTQEEVDTLVLEAKQNIKREKDTAQDEKAKQAILQWVADEVIDVPMAPSNYKTSLKGIRAVRARQKDVLKQHGWKEE